MTVATAVDTAETLDRVGEAPTLAAECRQGYEKTEIAASRKVHPIR